MLVASISSISSISRLPSFAWDSRAPTSLRSPTSNTHSLPWASCANPFTHVLAQASLDEEGDFCVIPKSADGILAILSRSPSLKQAWTRSLGKVLRREGDSNPRNPFGVYTLSRRASSTTRASLLRRNWLARRNSPCEFGLPPLLLLTRAREALVIFSRLTPCACRYTFSD